MRLEADVAQGLEDIAQNEISEKLKIPFDNLKVSKESVQFKYHYDDKQLRDLKSVIAVFAVLSFDIPRPKALLGHQYWTQICNTVREVIRNEPESYRSLYLSAAGSDSSVLKRFQRELAQTFSLDVKPEQGDLFLRVRKRDNMWEVLIRLTPRPLASRSWRTHNMEGALNASVAYAMAQLTIPQPNETILNLACGSGTFLIERQSNFEKAQQLFACDNNLTALYYTQEHLQHSKLSAHLIQADLLQNLPFKDQQFDVFFADLPFGNLVGSHAENEKLYPQLLKEAARLAKPGARMAIITHEVNLMDKLLYIDRSWDISHKRMITLSGLHPRIYILKRI